MQQDKIIGGTLAVVFVLVLAGVGVYIWKAQQPAQITKVRTAQQTKSAAKNSSNNGLAVVNNNGIGGGIAAEGQAQALGSSTEQKKQSQSQQKTINFAEYEKYKDAKSALFGEITAGTGAEAVAEKELSIGYKVWLTNGQLVDQTGSQQFTFVMGAKKVIPGLEQGIYGMKVGGKRLIIVPPAVAYGEQGKDGIPPNSVLIFEVELVDLR